jgi:hypothetical protein
MILLSTHQKNLFHQRAEINGLIIYSVIKLKVSSTLYLAFKVRKFLLSSGFDDVEVKAVDR